jgi:predicted O-methyltransferase YrrM
MRRWLRRCARRLARPAAAHLTVEVADLDQLRNVLGWSARPQLDISELGRLTCVEDVNQRRLRDAEVLGAACANTDPRICLEIGTGLGASTVIMGENAPGAVIHTVNIPPEDIATGGRLTTFAPTRDEIGRLWRERRLSNVRQIYANTATWQPDLAPIGVAFIDGCHDHDVVVNDTKLVLARARPGTVICGHDFHPGLAHRYGWIDEVCSAIETIFSREHLRGPVYHLRDSWTGLYRIPV